MKFNARSYRYPSIRNVVYARNGMVATSHPFAAQAGLEILQSGGNAVDAAIATAATLTVVEPTSNGIGADAFALIWHNHKLHGLNASGKSPESLSIGELIKKKIPTIPPFGWIPVTVPGAPAAWAALSKKFGLLPFEYCFKPAIRYANNGFPVAVTVGYFWEKAFQTYSKESQAMGDEFNAWFTTFAPHRRAPRIGELVTLKHHGDSLQKIAQSYSDEFYRGSLAQAIDSASKKYGGFIRKSDLEDFTPEWVDPLSLNYKGYTLWELPPNGQGIVALMALNILAHDHFSTAESADMIHLQIEALKKAFADAQLHIADPAAMRINSSQLLGTSYAQQRRREIETRASRPQSGSIPQGDTVYLATADSSGLMVSYIQSNYMGFGSGVVIPQTGIAMQNRGHNFNLIEDHVNCLAPKKRPYHTIIPGFITQDSDAIGPFGVMGGFMQPQGHLQVVMNLIDFAMNPQEALDRPRWMWQRDMTVHVENDFNTTFVQKLSQKGHEIQVQSTADLFGRGQIIIRSKDGILCGGTEKRADGHIACY